MGKPYFTEIILAFVVNPLLNVTYLLNNPWILVLLSAVSFSMDLALLMVHSIRVIIPDLTFYGNLLKYKYLCIHLYYRFNKHYTSLTTSYLLFYYTFEIIEIKLPLILKGL
jgi:hypothetical protein